MNFDSRFEVDAILTLIVLASVSIAIIDKEWTVVEIDSDSNLEILICVCLENIYTYALIGKSNTYHNNYRHWDEEACHALQTVVQDHVRSLVVVLHSQQRCHQQGTQEFGRIENRQTYSRDHPNKRRIEVLDGHSQGICYETG